MREEAAHDLRDDSAFEAAVHAFWPILAADEVFERLRSGALRLPSGVLTADEQQLLRAAWAATPGRTAADLALLDELTELLGDPPAPPEPEDDDPVPDDYGEVTTFADRNRTATSLAASASPRPAGTRAAGW